MATPTVAAITAQINASVADYLSIYGLKTSPFTEMIVSITVKPMDSEHVKVRLVYNGTCWDKSRLSCRRVVVEQFTSIPPSIGAIVVGLRSSAHTIGQKRELYELGGVLAKRLFPVQLCPWVTVEGPWQTGLKSSEGLMQTVWAVRAPVLQVGQNRR
jgi:hypothetical protein